MKLQIVDYIITQDKTKDQIKTEIQAKLSAIQKEAEVIYVADVFDAKKNNRYRVFSEQDKTTFGLPDSIVEVGLVDVPGSDSFDTYKNFDYNNSLYKTIKKLIPYLNLENKATTGTPANITNNSIDFDLGVNFVSSATSLTGSNITFGASNHNKPRNLGKSGLIYIESGLNNFNDQFKVLGDLPSDKSKVLFSYFINPTDSKIYLQFAGNLK